ncbi:unnamed protein product [Arabis nemorensis]|uniref:F-box domain-containing protein n=1 Tax=Arabis nemorensis TaxID=586526 RepID=A0A565C5Y5_9BRAS|nr:unnamed protein product [Arabis nemorensis]
METTKGETRRGKDETKDEALPDFSGLPREIITDVFLRLPAKSVGRFRCVSKPYCSMLSDPGFAKRHLALALKKDSGCQKLVVPSRNLHSVDLDSIGDGCEGTMVLSGVKDHPKDGLESVSVDWVEMIGSSNGLVCVYSQKGSSNGFVCVYSPKGGAFLHNPTTGESKRIPESMLDIVHACRHFGFGFDTLTEDYKVLKFVASDEGYRSVDVYSLKTDSWKRISGLPYKRLGCNPGVHFNGAINWVVKLHKGHNPKRVVVAAFDLKTEKFRDIPCPDEVEDCKYLKAATLKGRLCLVYDSFDKHDDIWVMNEYGLESSWTKIRLSMSYRSMTPLWSAKNSEEVLLQLDGKFVLYNFECKTCRNLEFSNVTFRKMFVASTYEESLISPNSYGNA